MIRHLKIISYIVIIALCAIMLIGMDWGKVMDAETISQDEWQAEINHSQVVDAIAFTPEAHIETIETVEETSDYIDRIASEYGLDPDIIRAIIQVESKGDPNAIGDGGKAIGLMQIQPKWHQMRMQRLGVTDLTDPESNVRVGCDYLAELLERYGSYERALTAYNTGNPDAVENHYYEHIMKEVKNASNN